MRNARHRWNSRLAPASSPPPRRWRRPGSSSRCWRPRSPRPRRTWRRRDPICRPRSSTSATPKSARRSTAMSATAPRRSAPMSTAGAYLLSVSPSQGLWVDANFKEDQLARMTPGDAGVGRRRRAARPCLPRPCRQPGARHRRGVQRHPGGERHRQFHQDRAARAGAHRARCRTTPSCACCGRAFRPPRGVGHRGAGRR